MTGSRKGLDGIAIWGLFTVRMPRQEIEIIGLSGNAEFFRRSFAPGEYVFGREPGCAVELNLNGVSRQHSKLTVTEDAVFVEDLGSMNGTCIGNRRITGRTAVAPGLRFEIGDALFHWRSVAAAVEKMPPSAIPKPAGNAAVRPVARPPLRPVPGLLPIVTEQKSSPLGAIFVVLALVGAGAFFVVRQMKHPNGEQTAEKPVVTATTPIGRILPEPTPVPATVAKAAERPPEPVSEPMKMTPEPAPATSPSATAKPADDYPGVPVLSLSPTIPAGDPDFQKLVAAAKWAASNSKWDRLHNDLRNSLTVLAGSGGSIARPANIERMIESHIPSAAFAQERFIRAVGAGVLNSFSAETERPAFIQWLFAHPAILTAFDDTILPQDKPRAALQAWWEIWKSEEDEGREQFANLAIACALVFDEPVRINPTIFGFSGGSSSADSPGLEKEASALNHYRFFRDSAKRGVLKAPIAEMTPRDLVWVVDAPVPESELVWAQKHMTLSRQTWSKAYGMIRYRMDRATQGVNPYTAYTLAQILKEGGICGDQAYFAAMTAKANGIPAMVIAGEGDRGGHAWFGYKASRNAWNLTTGRYADNYAAGSTTDPQTHRTLKEHELKMYADPVRRTEGYAKSEHLVSLAKMFGSAKRDDLAAVALDDALRITPKHLDAWFEKLAALRTAKVNAEDWQREVARMRATFHGYSDVIQKIDKIEADYVSLEGDYDAARKLVRLDAARMAHKDKERTDLILDGIFREAELAETTGDSDKIGRIYREAMREKGNEVVAFRKIAKRYYEWGKKSKKGETTVRDILGTFEQKHKEPFADVFAIGAYRSVLGELITMVKEQGMTTQEHSLKRRETKLKNLQEKLGKEQSKNAAR